MKKYVPTNLNCEIFKVIAGTIWGRVTRAHQVGVNLKEVGITADIVAEILWLYKIKGASIGVYAQASWNEKIFGSDLDIFVEVTKGRYVWFPMQAKLLKLQNIYDGIVYDSSLPKQQWDKLMFLKRVANPYYLLYNGNNIVQNKPLDNCGFKITLSQYGCSLVEPEIVRVVTNAKHPTRPKFDDFHPNLAQPWKVLTCCPTNYSGMVTYTLAEIGRAMKDRGDKYKRLASFGILDDLPLNIIDDNNQIISASNEIRWDPLVVFILPNNDK